MAYRAVIHGVLDRIVRIGITASGAEGYRFESCRGCLAAHPGQSRGIREDPLPANCANERERGKKGFGSSLICVHSRDSRATHGLSLLPLSNSDVLRPSFCRGCLAAHPGQSRGIREDPLPANLANERERGKKGFGSSLICVHSRDSRAIHTLSLRALPLSDFDDVLHQVVELLAARQLSGQVFGHQRNL